MNEHEQWQRPAEPSTAPGAAPGERPFTEALRPRRWLFATTAIAVVAMVAGLLIGNAWSDRDGGVAATPVSERIELFDEGLVQQLYESAIKSVVKIEVVQGQPGSFSFGGRGQGSGFLVSSQGEILTNYHVVQGASRVTIVLEDGTRLPGEVAGTDPANDLALVRVAKDAVKSITPLVLGDSALVKPGQLAVALGNPYGFQGSVTVGVVSGVNRSLPSITRRPILGMIQTDAAIFPGNSGGPLLSSRGEVIGINTAVTTEGTERLGFAVPSNTARSVLARLSAGATIKRPWLGVSLLTLDSDRAESAGLTVRRGVYLVDVVAGSPAEQAGLRPGRTAAGQPAPGGDVIVAADGRPVATVDDLISYFNGKQPGDTVTLTLLREGKEVQVTVKLAEWPDSLS